MRRLSAIGRSAFGGKPAATKPFPLHLGERVKVRGINTNSGFKNNSSKAK